MRIKKTHPEAVIPKYATEGSAGFDLVTVEDTVIEPGETKLIRTGLAFEVPRWHELQVRPRSGISLKTKLRVILGTVDSDYRGEVGVIVDNIGDKDELITKGTRIAQGVLTPISIANMIIVDELSQTERGTGGFGSTGKEVRA